MPPYSASPQLGSYADNASDEARGGNPFYSLPVTVQRTPLPSGTAGTFAALEAMARCVRGEVPPDFCGYRKSAIINLAATLTQDCQDSRQEIEALFNYAARQIKYESHPINEQVVQDACRTIQFKKGDCVSKSVLLATLLASMDYDVRFVAQYFNDEQMYSHVYVEAFDKQLGNWIALDPVASDKPMGWTQTLPDGGFETPYDIF